VVRLKGGDPFVFGRGGEEALALARAGISYEVVPGVTSAIAVPAYAGVPLTHRGLSTAFAVVTGQEARDKLESTADWKALARLPTLVVLMGMRRIRAISRALVDAGRAPDTPAVAISRGATQAQQVLRATLASLPDALAAHPLPTPGLIVIGEVVTLRKDLAWYGPDSGAMPTGVEGPWTSATPAAMRIQEPRGAG